jgi:hypothetical protein
LDVAVHDGVVEISPGCAVDAFGNLVEINGPCTLKPAVAGEWFVVLRYSEKNVDPHPSLGSEESSEGSEAGRVQELAQVLLLRSEELEDKWDGERWTHSGPPASIPLGRVHDSGGNWCVDQEVRVYTGFFEGLEDIGQTEPQIVITVNGERWVQVEDFSRSGANDHVYVVRFDDDDAATIQFGDGANGARLPTGRDNIVVATYRCGGGAGASAVSVRLAQPDRQGSKEPMLRLSIEQTTDGITFRPYDLQGKPLKSS